MEYYERKVKKMYGSTFLMYDRIEEYKLKLNSLVIYKILVKASIMYGRVMKYQLSLLNFFNNKWHRKLFLKIFEELKDSLNGFLELKWRLYGQKDLGRDSEMDIQEERGYRAMYDIQSGNESDNRICTEVDWASEITHLIVEDFKSTGTSFEGYLKMK